MTSKLTSSLTEQKQTITNKQTPSLIILNEPTSTNLQNKPIETTTTNTPKQMSQSFQFITLDPNERLPRPPPPQNATLLSQTEQMVHWAVSSKHENAPSLHPNTRNNDPNNDPNSNINSDPNNTSSSDANSTNRAEALKCHHLLTTTLLHKSDPSLLLYTLHALLTANHGRELDRLVGNSKVHGQLIHLIMRLDPFGVGVEMGRGLAEVMLVRRGRAEQVDGADEVSKVDGGKVAVEGAADGGATKVDVTQADADSAVKPQTPKKGVQISLSSIVYKEDQKYITPTLPFFNYEIADVHLYLLVALVANNSLLGVSVVRAVWKLLTDFGYKWMKENSIKKTKEEMKLDEKCSSPPAKRRKLDDPPQSAAATKEELDVPEGLKAVPGMNGLSVDFVRDTFYKDKDDEDICSERLPRGRVKRLLLTLLNIFRLNHRSKNDLLHEISTNFPHYKTCPLPLHRWYIHMCLQLVHLVPTLEGPIMNLLVDQALEMDVQIKINDKGGVFLDEQDEDDGVVRQSVKKRSYQIISQENKPTSIDVDDGDEISEIAERLDNLMDTLCQRIEAQTCFAADSVSEALAAVVNARRLYRHLDGIFDKKVRTTHRSKFVPFIFFVLFGREHDALEAVGKLMTNRKNTSSKLPNAADDTLQKQGETLEIDHIISASINQTDFLYRGFCAKLIDLFYNPVDAGDLPSQTIVCTLASFVSRATYVCPETVCETVAAILQWAEAYIEAHGSHVATSLVKRQSSMGNTQHQRDIHALFYTACQSAFYIMCFRGAEALHYYHAAWRHRDEQDSQYASPESVNLGAKRWKAICNHSLQPLKYCLESVRVEFLYLAEDLDLFVEDLESGSSESHEDAKLFIEQMWSDNEQKSKDKTKATPTRKRSSIISTAATQEKKRLVGGVGGLGKGSNPLDSYFPFDPYLLKSSYKHVHPYYRNWEDCILSVEDVDAANETSVEIVDDLTLIQGSNDQSDGHEEEEDDDDALTCSDEENLDKEEEIEDHSDDDDDDQSESNLITTESKKPEPLSENDVLEVEIRRCRAMSTGSQASW